MKLFKIRTVADLTKTYIITSSKLKVAHFSIIALTICTTFAIIANIRAPVFLQILLFLLGGFLIYKPQLFTPNLKTIQNPCLSLDPGWFL
ncbi:hypothetical protein V2L85_10970, partial [Streptococcus pneumoniae]